MIQTAGVGTSTSSTSASNACLEHVLRGLADCGLQNDVIVATLDPLTHTSIHGSKYLGKVRMWTVPSGLHLSPAAVRNALVSQVETPYLLMLDDAMVLEGEVDFMNALCHVLESVALGQYDLVGGCIGARAGAGGGCQGPWALQDEKGGEISFLPIHTEAWDTIARADLVDLFFVARVSLILTVGWDEDLLWDADHEDFFLRARGKLVVGYYPPWVVSYGKRQDGRCKDPGDTCELSRPVIPLGERLRDREAPVLHGYKAMLSKNGLFRFYVEDRGYELVCDDSLDAPYFPLMESGMDQCVFYSLTRGDGGDGGGGVPGEAAVRRVVVPGAGDEADDDNYPRDKFPRLARPWAIQGDPHRDDASSPCQASIALMTVAIGRYMEFVPDLWVSAQRYFLPDCHVELFVFTDNVTHALGQDPAIHLVGQFRLGWPYDSLMRFEMYQSQADVLKERFQYVYAVDSDAVFTAVMGREILGLSVATLSAWFQGASRDAFPYDANPDSPFYMAPHQGRNYFAGGFYGGEVDHVLSLWASVVPKIRDLLEVQTYVPPCHDESILNHWYNIVHPPDVILGAEYLYPEPPADTWVNRVMQLYYKRELGTDSVSFRPGREPKLLNLGTRKASETVDNSIRQVEFRDVAHPVIISVEAGLRPRSCSSGVALEGTVNHPDRAEYHHIKAELVRTHCMHWISVAQDHAEREKTCHSLNMTQCGMAEIAYHGRWGTFTSIAAVVRHSERPNECMLAQQHFPLLSDRMKGTHRGILRWKPVGCDVPATPFCCAILQTTASPRGQSMQPSPNF